MNDSLSDAAITIRIQADDFDINTEQQNLCNLTRSVGAIVSFTGLVRDINDSLSVSSMELEHYPGMTERTIKEIVEQAGQRWSLLGATVIHRIGVLAPTDQIVLVSVSSLHRGEAFQACEYIMDFLKTNAPFWKKEKTSVGERWVDARTTDKNAEQRWRQS
jgi:molybdopterin synthase catalytic subunit